jgi:C-terminal processing protease CtpA/Prc
MLSLALLLAASSVPQAPDALSASERKEAIAKLAEALQQAYVFPEIGERLSASVRGRSESGGYDGCKDAESFARALTEDLQAISHDKHLRVRTEGGPPRAEAPRPRFPRTEEDFRRRNFGFEKVEILPGNLGYLDLRMFAPAQLSGETLEAAMGFLANTDALIVDLRQNGGGQPDMVQLFCSYLFDAQPVHLNDLYFRPEDETHQFWTLPWLPGKRYPGKDVFVLTSRDTFSGAEECAYDLQAQHRAQIVGETTGGGAHPGDMRKISEHLNVFVPTGRAINPVTKTDWEGTGVQPDVQVPADQALATARKLALKKLQDGVQDADRRDALSRALEEVERPK